MILDEENHAVLFRLKPNSGRTAKLRKSKVQAISTSHNDFSACFLDSNYYTH
jgi:hypothetical protein